MHAFLSLFLSFVICFFIVVCVSCVLYLFSDFVFLFLRAFCLLLFL